MKPLIFQYTGSIQTIQLPRGTYKIECWGADGMSASNTILDMQTMQLEKIENRGGFGAYVCGAFRFEKSTILFLAVGGAGKHPEKVADNLYRGGHGYNGEGDAVCDYDELRAGGGGGATHVATKHGLLSDLLANNPDSLLCVAGSGGGATGNRWCQGSSARETFTLDEIPKLLKEKRPKFVGWQGGGGFPFGRCRGNHLNGLGGKSYISEKSTQNTITNPLNSDWKEKPINTTDGIIEITTLN